jgi:hypothetical protein
MREASLYPFVQVRDENAIVARVLDSLWRAREPQQALNPIELQASSLGESLGRELVSCLEAREAECCVQRRKVVALEVFHEREQRHPVVGNVEW